MTCPYCNSNETGELPAGLPPSFRSGWKFYFYSFSNEDYEAWFKCFKLRRVMLIDLTDRETSRLVPEVDSKKKLEDEGTNVP